MSSPLLTIRFVDSMGAFEVTRHWYWVPRVGERVTLTILTGDDGSGSPVEQLVDHHVQAVQWFEDGLVLVTLDDLLPQP